jgi:hypothetical protein
MGNREWYPADERRRCGSVGIRAPFTISDSPFPGLLDILDLLAHLFDQQLELDGGFRQFLGH